MRISTFGTVAGGGMPGARSARRLLFVAGVGALALSGSSAVRETGARAEGPAPGEEHITFTQYPRLGSADDAPLPRGGPGRLVLAGGGGNVPDAFRWMQKQVAGDAARGGDVVIIVATPRDESDELVAAAPFNSVRTVCVPAHASAAELAQAARLVDAAEAVWFGGGQQWRYARWKGSPLLQAVQRVYERGGVVGGVSAGLAILGEHAFDGRRASSDEVVSAALLERPDNPNVEWARSLFSFPPLRGVITDTHFRERDRFGRLVAFMARQPVEEILGVGVDEQTALLVDERGQARLVRNSPERGAAYLLRGRGHQVRRGKRLGPVAVHVTRLDSPDARFDFSTWRGHGTAEYQVVVDGSALPFYSRDPYTGGPGDG